MPAPSNEFMQRQVPVIKFYLNHGARTDTVDKQGKRLIQLINPDDFDAVYKKKFLTDGRL